MTSKSGGTPTPVLTLFESTTESSIKRQQLTELAAGTLAAIRVQNFFSKELCDEIMKKLETIEMGSYDEQVVSPRIAKLGPAVFDYYLDGGIGEDYWDHRDQSNITRSKLASTGDPLETARKKLLDAWGAPVENAAINNQELFAGMIREINHGARIHFDEVERELPGGLDDTPIAQLAFNCHLDMPETGGEATVFRRRWFPIDEEKRDGYGYSYELVQSQPSVSVRAEIGDAVFFDPRNYHRVEPNVTDGRRVTLSFFIGITSDGKMKIWS